MTEKDLELKKIEKILYKKIQLGFVSGDNDSCQIEGMDNAAQAILTYIREEEVKLLEALKQEIKSSSDIYYEERKFNDLIQKEINRIKEK